MVTPGGIYEGDEKPSSIWTGTTKQNLFLEAKFPGARSALTEHDRPWKDYELQAEPSGPGIIIKQQLRPVWMGCLDQELQKMFLATGQAQSTEEQGRVLPPVESSRCRLVKPWTWQQSQCCRGGGRWGRAATGTLEHLGSSSGRRGQPKSGVPGWPLLTGMGNAEKYVLSGWSKTNVWL